MKATVTFEDKNELLNACVKHVVLQCDYSNQGHQTKFSTNLTNENRGG